MTTYKIISDEEEGDMLEVTDSVETKRVYSKSDLEAKKIEIEFLLAEFEK